MSDTSPNDHESSEDSMSRPARRLTCGVVWFAGLLLLGLSSCSTAEIAVGRVGASDGGTGGSQPVCSPTGDECTQGGECCSGVCDATSARCGSAIQDCKLEGTPCSSPLDCCGMSCVEGACGGACTQDEQACVNDAECCSGRCVADLCEPLNMACRTAGNACSESTDCCSALCEEGICSFGSSYCVQQGDACRASGDCCTGNCAIDEGGLLGTCVAPIGPANCLDGLAGTVCEDCNECCSRLCAPFGDSGIRICQPAGGCRVTGELCRRDLDCCGGDPDSGLAGAGNVTCVKQDDAEFGVCRNALACSPQGNVCHFVDYACSVSEAANRCCDGQGNSGACQLDRQGIPRCSTLGDDCREAGQTCSSTIDCCEGNCVADAQGSLRCSESACGEVGAACTISADCCLDLRCQQVVGSTTGSCVAL